MGFAPVKTTIARHPVEGSKRWTSCPRCGEYNEIGTLRCRDRMNTLERTIAPPRSRLASRVIVHAKSDEPALPPNLDALWGELERLTRADELVWFQCPECESLVDGTATHCACGAVFADPEETVGYECPMCGARVASDARRCRCGAWFSD